MKRLFDIIFSFTGLVLLSPLFLTLSILVTLSRGRGVFFTQTRVGKNGQDFKLYKFRTMLPESEKSGLLTVGGRDPRITPIGYYLRKYKLDELPQLFNVLNGSMSFVGPRPEVRKYVEFYTPEQKQVLLVKPGITDYASLQYFKESELLAKSSHPEKTYVEEIMPAKLALNQKYIVEAGMITDVKIIISTVLKIFGK